MSIDNIKDENKKHFDWQFDQPPYEYVFNNNPISDIINTNLNYDLQESPNFISAYTGYEPYNPLKTLIDELDDNLSNIHEPISEHDKKIQELESAILNLQLSDRQKDELIQELQEKISKKQKTRSNTKSTERKLRKEVKELKEIVKSYQNDWKFTKDMHKEESKDVSPE